MPRVSVCSFVICSFCYHLFTLHPEEPFLVESKRGTNWDPIGSSRNTLWSVARLRQAALEATPSLTWQVAAQLVSSKVRGIYIASCVWLCLDVFCFSGMVKWWHTHTHTLTHYILSISAKPGGTSVESPRCQQWSLGHGCAWFWLAGSGAFFFPPRKGLVMKFGAFFDLSRPIINFFIGDSSPKAT